MIDISLSNISKSYGVKDVLEEISFDINTGDKVAIVGPNGAGKTTLFKIISKIIEYDTGALSIRKDLKLSYLEQLPQYNDELIVEDVIELAFEDISEIEVKLTQLEKELSERPSNSDTLLEKYGKFQNLYEIRGGYTKDVNKNKIVTGLGISKEQLSRPFNSLSGGEKTKINLARILLEMPDVLLLDEPTNHLDIPNVEWLEGFIREYRGTVVMISHDRYFLDRTVNKIIEIDLGKSEIYDGNYSYYLDERRIRYEIRMKAFKEQQKEIKHMEEAAARLREWAGNADNEDLFRKAKEIEKRLEKLDRLNEPAKPRKKMGLSFNTEGRSGKDVVYVSELSKSFDDKVLFENIEFFVGYGERVAIIGANGCGKSTLIKLLLYEIPRDYGEIRISRKAEVGYLPQQVEFLNEEKNLVELIRDLFPVDEGRARAWLARFLFYSDDVFRKIKELSGGEKVRLKLCTLMMKSVNFLILDEPSNHLDIDSREILEKAIEEFEGTVLFVSHDRYFINKTADRIIEIHKGNLRFYPGNYDYYKEKVKTIIQDEPEKIIEEKSALSNQSSKSSNTTKKVSNNNQKKIDKLEIEINTIDNKIKELNAEMSSSGDNYGKLMAIQKELDEIKKYQDELFIEWETLLESE